MNKKYNISHFIDQLPKAMTMDKIISALKKSGIPERTFYNDKALKRESSADIPGNRLRKYARFFDVSIESLYNYEDDIKPAVRKSKRLITQLGLKR